MRPTTFLPFPLLLGLAACGGGSSSTSLTVTCGGQISAAGIAHIDVSVRPPAGQTPAAAVLTYPDPVNSGQTGSVTILEGRPCVITRMADKG